MSDQEPRYSISLLCDDANRVRRVLHNPAGLPARPDGALLSLFHGGSKQKALRLVQAIRDRQAAFGWELYLDVRDRSIAMSFVGVTVPGAILLAGAEDPALAHTLLGRALEELEVTEPPPLPISPPETVGLYEQIAALNNQLIAMQREMAKQNAEMRRLLEDRAKIAAMAAHDLRSPLQAIVSSAQALATMLEKPANVAPAPLVAIIQRNARTMLSLVNDILAAYSSDIGRLELSMRPLDLEALVRSNAESNRALAAQKQITLTFDHRGPVPLVLGDAARLEHLLNNLVHNAIKFSPPSSTIRMGLSHVEGHALLEVADQGSGIEPEKLAALLRGTAVGSRSGTQSESGYGLGLHIVRTVVEKHRGTLDAESQPHKGTTFSIRLPAYRQP